MKLRVKNNGHIFDAERGLSLALLATGVVEEVKEPVAPTVSPEWGIGISAETEEPYISAKGNKQTMNWFGRQKNPPVFLGQACPKEVFDAFQKRRVEYNPESGSKPGDGGLYALRLAKNIDDGEGEHIVAPY